MSIAGTASFGDQTMTLSGDGMSNLAANQGSMRMRVTAAGKTSELEMVYDGLVFYMTSELFRDALPGGAKWMKLDLKKSSAALGLDTSSFETANPAGTLESLRASGKVTKVGQDLVRGVSTTHYRVIVDPSKVKGSSKVAQAYDLESTPIDVWIDAQSRVRRTKIGYSYTPSGQDRISQEFTIDMYRYGAPVTIEIPAENDVFDATDVASQQIQKDLQK
jgi:hypothetical protein